jgi:hypothetical protein
VAHAVDLLLARNVAFGAARKLECLTCTISPESGRLLTAAGKLT